MKKKLLFLILTIISAIFFFFAWAHFYSFVAYPYIAMLLGGRGTQILGNTALVIVGHFILTLFFAINIWQLLHLRFFIPFWKLQTSLYIVLLLVVVLLKSRGIQGINLNPLNLISLFLESPFEFLSNIFFFIPLGSLFFIKHLAFRRSIFYGLFFIILLELSQYFLHLGIFDIVDILLNTCGFLLGYLLLDLVFSSGWILQKKGNYYLVVRDNKIM
ncbi:VanZ family protein [Streptococcus cameli]